MIDVHLVSWSRVEDDGIFLAQHYWHVSVHITSVTGPSVTYNGVMLNVFFSKLSVLGYHRVRPTC